jgi:hypothetical protein
LILCRSVLWAGFSLTLIATESRSRSEHSWWPKPAAKSDRREHPNYLCGDEDRDAWAAKPGLEGWIVRLDAEPKAN